MRFKEIQTQDGALATYSIGKGPKLVFLHGGPGDTHHYLREVAHRLKDRFACILYDQRGTGRSYLKTRTPTKLSLPSFISDLDAVLDFYGVDKALLFGHSWGAMLGLFYSIERSSRVARCASVSIGPLTDEYGAMIRERTLAALTEEEQAQWNALRAARNIAVKNDNLADVLKLDNEMMYLRAKSWVYNPELRERFLDSYFADPPVDRQVNQWAWNSLAGYFQWEKLRKIQGQVWLCSGNNDSSPPEQIQTIEKHLRFGSSLILENCGHIPWLERSDVFYPKLLEFLAD